MFKHVKTVHEYSAKSAVFVLFTMENLCFTAFPKRQADTCEKGTKILSLLKKSIIFSFF